MDEYLDHDAMGLAELVRTKQVSPAELLAAAQARADAVNPRINAIVRRLNPPVSRAGVEAPFYGVPFLFKDLDHHLAGHPTGAGSRAWQSYVHTENDVVSDRWLAAGLVVFGRTNTPEFGAKGITEPLVGGRPAIRGISITRRVDHPEARRPRWPPGSCRAPRRAMGAARSAYPRPRAASSV